MMLKRKCKCIKDCIIKDILFENKLKKYYKNNEYIVEICDTHYIIYDIGSKEHIYLNKDFDKYFTLIK